MQIDNRGAPPSAIGFVGLGKMGLNMVTRLHQAGHRVVAFDRDADRRVAAEALGVQAVAELAGLAIALPAPRVVWLMLPAGAVTGHVIDVLGGVLQPGDVIVDGGNSDFRDTQARARALAETGVVLVDCGTSGGLWGLKNGYCLMVGADEALYQRLTPALSALAAPGGSLRTGAVGSGHYAKMVHNAMEYGLMQAYAEGFGLLESAERQHGFRYDLGALGALWENGGVIRSWLLQLLTAALRENPRLDGIAGFVEDSGMGRWAAREATEAAVPTPVLTAALQMRFVSRQPELFSAKINAALRNQFGGHAVRLTPGRTDAHLPHEAADASMAAPDAPRAAPAGEGADRAGRAP